MVILHGKFDLINIANNLKSQDLNPKILFP